MDNLKRMVKIRVRFENKKYNTLTRIKVGRALFIYASLPLLSFWAYAFALPMMIPISFPVWVKSKIIDFDTWRRLR